MQQIVLLICLRCGFGKDPDHPWRSKSGCPGSCPRCKSADWDKPKKLIKGVPCKTLKAANA
jgi:hypothetical protein